MQNTPPSRAAVRVQLLALALLVALPSFSGPYLVHLITLALIYSIFAIGYD